MFVFLPLFRTLYNRGHMVVDATRVEIRSRTLAQWSLASVVELLTILEGSLYVPPMKRDHDSQFIVDHLWRLHRNELTEPVLRRLRLLVGTNVLSERAIWDLSAYLLAFEGERTKLQALWESRHVARRSFADMFVLMDCFVHLQIDDPKVIEELIQMVEKPAFMFEPRRVAMMTLGSLSAVRETRAAEVIRRVVFDSEPYITAGRDRVLEFLETPAIEWATCSRCCYGRVQKPDSHGTKPCPDCVGIGWIRHAPMFQQT